MRFPPLFRCAGELGEQVAEDGVAVDIVERKAGPVHVDKLHHIAVPQHVAYVGGVGFRIYNTVQQHAVDNKLVHAEMYAFKVAGILCGIKTK